MKLIKWMMGCCSALLLTGCVEKHHKTIAVVICDASYSIFLNGNAGNADGRLRTSGTGNAAELLRYIDQLPGILAKGNRGITEIHWLAVSNNSSDSMLSRVPWRYEKVNVREQKLLDMRNRNIITEVKNNLVIRSANKQEKTCLLTTIEHAAAMLQEQLAVEDGDALHIIILSDMIEACDNSIVGPLFFEPETVSRTPATLKKLDGMQPNFSFTGSGIKITAIDVARKTDPAVKRELSLLWKAALSKLGYDGEFRFLPGLPSVF